MWEHPARVRSETEKCDTLSIYFEAVTLFEPVVMMGEHSTMTLVAMRPLKTHL